MSIPKVLIGSEEAKSAAAAGSHRWGTHPVDPIWAWVGFVFLAVGGVDLALAWYPLQMGNREWEFGSYTATMNGLPVPMLGLAALAFAGGVGRRWASALSALVAVALLFMVLFGLVLWAASIPLAMEAVPPQLLGGVRRALVKTSVQAVAYSAMLLYILGRSVRRMLAKAG